LTQPTTHGASSRLGEVEQLVAALDAAVRDGETSVLLCCPVNVIGAIHHLNAQAENAEAPTRLILPPFVPMGWYGAWTVWGSVARPADVPDSSHGAGHR
jgi:hypothetical protein